jgi:hypothetical protein
MSLFIDESLRFDMVLRKPVRNRQNINKEAERHIPVTRLVSPSGSFKQFRWRERCCTVTERVLLVPFANHQAFSQSLRGSQSRLFRKGLGFFLGSAMF